MHFHPVMARPLAILMMTKAEKRWNTTRFGCESVVGVGRRGLFMLWNMKYEIVLCYWLSLVVIVTVEFRPVPEAIPIRLESILCQLLCYRIIAWNLTNNCADIFITIMLIATISTMIFHARNSIEYFSPLMIPRKRQLFEFISFSFPRFGFILSLLFALSFVTGGH